MADFLGLMKQAAELKSKMESMQAELDQIEVDGRVRRRPRERQALRQGRDEECQDRRHPDQARRRRRSSRISSLPPTLMRGARPRRCCRRR